MAKLTEAEIGARLAQAGPWTRLGDQIVRCWQFPSATRALEFVNQVAALARQQEHYPEIVLRFRDVRVELTTHADGGLTDTDFAMAAAIDSLHAEA